MQRLLEEIFQDLHRHPEIAKEEFRTTAIIKEKLKDLQIRDLHAPIPTGVIAEIGNENGHVIALRADIDALPIQEATGLAYASEEKKKMHACGHDFHTTAILGACMLLKEREEKLQGKIRILFQPGEEINYGALAIMETGMVEDVEEFYGIHTDPTLEAGVLGIREGSIMASPDRFKITIHGKSGHGAQPHTCIDPVPCMASMILSLQQIVSRRLSPFSSGVLSVTHVNAGNTWNVIPEKVEMEGTIRTMCDDDRDLGEKMFRQVAESTARSYDCSVDIEYIRQSRPLINSKDQTSFAEMIARKMGIPVVEQEPSMIGEDFAEYLKNRPGCFIRVGTGIGPALHHPEFHADPSVLEQTAKYLAKLAEERLVTMKQIG